MSAKEQIKILADYIMAEVEGEPSQDEGAGDTAVRIIKKYKAAFEEILITKPIECDGNFQGDYACDLHIKIAEEVLGKVKAPAI